MCEQGPDGPEPGHGPLGWRAASVRLSHRSFPTSLLRGLTHAAWPTRVLEAGGWLVFPVGLTLKSEDCGGCPAGSKT